MSSNVPNYEETVCFVGEGDPQKLVDKMMDRLQAISSHSIFFFDSTFC